MPGQGAPRKKGAAGEAEGFGKNPTDRGKLGSKRHLHTSGEGIPLSIIVTAANVNDLTMLDQLLGAQVVPTPEKVEQKHLCLDGAYKYARGYEIGQERCYELHFQPKVGSTPPVEDGDTRHPARRWVVEVCHSWLNRFRRIMIRWEKRLTNYLGFLHLAICLIIMRKLRIRAS